MTSIAKVNFTIEMDTVLSQDVLKKIRDVGYSRIPIIMNGNKNLIIAILLSKSLIGLDTSKNMTV